jgi:hypothetical protein
LAANPDAAQAFEGLSYSHSREYAEWVSEAKRPATRERRAVQAVERILRTRLPKSPPRRPGKTAVKTAATTGSDPSGPAVR